MSQLGRRVEFLGQYWMGKMEMFRWFFLLPNLFLSSSDAAGNMALGLGLLVGLLGLIYHGCLGSTQPDPTREPNESDGSRIKTSIAFNLILCRKIYFANKIDKFNSCHLSIANEIALLLAK